MLRDERFDQFAKLTGLFAENEPAGAIYDGYAMHLASAGSERHMPPRATKGSEVRRR
jgi:hypothetical protein